VLGFARNNASRQALITTPDVAKPVLCDLALHSSVHASGQRSRRGFLWKANRKPILVLSQAIVNVVCPHLPRSWLDQIAGTQSGAINTPTSLPRHGTKVQYSSARATTNIHLASSTLVTEIAWGDYAAPGLSSDKAFPEDDCFLVVLDGSSKVRPPGPDRQRRIPVA
jgi:hypothetical protein